MSPKVNTKKVKEHRPLHFNSIDQCLAEVDRILAADERGTLVHWGSWTAGQVMGHIAAWIEYGYDGYPMSAPPFFVRWYLKMLLNKTLKSGMPKGLRIPSTEGGTYGTEDMPTTAAGHRLKTALKRLQSGENAPHDSPAYGPMSHEKRVLLNLRHAELHLGFLEY